MQKLNEDDSVIDVLTDHLCVVWELSWILSLACLQVFAVPHIYMSYGA